MKKRFSCQVAGEPPKLPVLKKAQSHSYVDGVDFPMSQCILRTSDMQKTHGYKLLILFTYLVCHIEGQQNQIVLH